MVRMDESGAAAPETSAEAPAHALTARIADYALIGDCRGAALVSRSGSIDWLCLPRFDSPSVFAALLGSEENGRWSIAAVDAAARTSRAYRAGTLILETQIETDTGAATLIDFMPQTDDASSVVRLVVGRRGIVAMETRLVIRFDYGSTVPWVNRVDDETLTALAGPDLLVLRTPVDLRGEDHRTVGRFTVEAGQRIPFTLVHQSALAPLPQIEDPWAALEASERAWRAFSDRCPDVGPYTDLVRRSVITLKALTNRQTGGIVAAATTSLPEWIGSGRNWDYRYCWLRDAAYTLQAFMHLGYIEEAEAWRDWLMRAIAGNPEQIQIMYGIGGERLLWEQEIPWLEGFRGSQPVRIGNAAAGQRQLDVYGEVADAIGLARQHGLPSHPRGSSIRGVSLNYLARVWREPDQGIWETRGPPQHFVHSKVMAWAAFNRAAASDDATPDEKARWKIEADAIHEEVCRLGFDVERGTFVQAYGSKTLDAGLLRLAIVGFLPPDDPRILGTVDAIMRDLVQNGFVRRYDTETGQDGLSGGEGVFLACSFWLADNLILGGREDEARALYDRLTALCNDVGLLAEEYDVAGGEMLGNFPQAFSHVGIINTALDLWRSHGPAVERAADGVQDSARAVTKEMA